MPRKSALLYVWIGWDGVVPTPPIAFSRTGVRVLDILTKIVKLLDPLNLGCTSDLAGTFDVDLDHVLR